MSLTRIVNGVIKTSEFETYEGVLSGQELIEIIVNNKNYKIPLSSLGSNITTFFTAIAFKRTNTQPSIPIGGSYSNPIPTGGWTQYIPSGSETLWATTRIFSEDGNPPQQTTWSQPSKMTDTETFDVEFSSIELNPGTPSTHPNNWSNVGDETTIWMATRNIINGVGGVWSIIKIKGNKGTDGKDGTNYEYVFKITENNVEPTPRIDELQAVQQAEYIPNGWSDDPLSITATNQFEWVSKRTRVEGVWGTFSRAKVWAKYGSDGNGYEYIYTLTETDSVPTISEEKDPSSPATEYTDDDWYPLGWTDEPQGVTSIYQYEWISVRRGSTGTWGVFSTPAKHSKWGVDGKDGTDYEYIFIRTEFGDTPYDVSLISAQQIDDYVPSGETYGTWSDNSLGPDNTLQLEWSAKRKKVNGIWQQFSLPAIWARYGNDGNGIEYIYKVTTTDVSPDTPSSSEIDKSISSPATTFQDDDWYPTGWTDEPTGVTNTTRFEWVALRKKVNGSWLVFNSPVLWSSFGRDGNGIEYIYSRTTSSTAPTKPTSSSTKNPASTATTYQDDEWFPVGWTDDPSGVTSVYTYEWACIRKKINGVWNEFSEPAVFSHFGKDGRAVNIKGSIPLVSDLPATGNELNDAWIVLSDGHLYICIGLPNTWFDAGLFQGSDGISSKVIQLYKRSTTVPTVPSTTLTYYFSTNSLSGDLEGWTTSIPAPDGDKPCYTILATASSNTGSDEILTGTWTSPEIYIPVVGNTATIQLYKRNATLPDVPTATLTYNFYTKTLTGNLNGWSVTPPAKTVDPLYVTAATVYSTTLEDTILTGEWAEPVIWTQDGEQGNPGINSRTVNLTAATQAFIYDVNNANPSPVNSLLTATALNTEPDVTVYYEFIVGSTTMQNTTSNTYTYIPKTSYLNMPEKVTVCIREGNNSGTVLARDTTTMIGIKNGTNGTDGKPAIFFSNSNESHGVPTTYDGTVLSFDNSGCDISVWEGATQLAVDQSSPYSNSTFRITTIANNITVGSTSIVGDGKTLRFSNITTFTANNGYINFVIVVKRSDGTETTLISTQTFWKSKQGADGKGEEHIFTRTSTKTPIPTPPATSETNYQNDDYAPSPWSDEPVGTTFDLPYEWVAQRKKTNNIWGAFSTPVIWQQNSINTRTVYLYKRVGETMSLPVKPTATLTYDFVEGTLTGNTDGWTLYIPADNKDVCYRIFATALSETRYDTITTDDWSTVEKYVSSGYNTAIVNLYKLSADTPSKAGITAVCTYTFATRNLVVTSGTLDGWSYVMPTHNGYPMWSISASVYAIGVLDTIAANEWSEPVKLHEDTVGPYLDFSGLYSSTTTYYGNNESVSLVKFNGIYYQALTTAGEFSGILPTNTSKWKPKNSYNNIATGLLFAEEAYIDNLGVRKLRTAESHTRAVVENSKFAAFDDGDNLIIDFSGENIFGVYTNDNFNISIGTFNYNSQTYISSYIMSNFSITNPSNIVIIPELKVKWSVPETNYYWWKIELLNITTGSKDVWCDYSEYHWDTSLKLMFTKPQQILSLANGTYNIVITCNHLGSYKGVVYAEIDGGNIVGSINYNTVISGGRDGIRIKKLDDPEVYFTGNFTYGGEWIMKAGNGGFKVQNGSIQYTKQGDGYWQEAFT